MRLNPGIYIKGFYKLSIDKDKFTRFSKYCGRKHILLYDKQINNNAVIFKVALSDYKRVRYFFEKAQVEYYMIKKSGLPIWLCNKYVRPWIILFLIFLLWLFIISFNIWNINIKGNEFYSDEQILEFINNENIQLGTKKSDINCKKIERLIKEEFENVEWVSCSINKTTLNINIFDTEKAVIINSKNNSKDLICDTDCVIMSIIPIAGLALCKEGEEVKAGQIIISSQVPILNDYGEEIDKVEVQAKGYVTGRITEEYYDKFSLDEYKKDYISTTKNFQIGYGNFVYDLLAIKSTDNIDKDRSVKKLKLGRNFYLPYFLASEKRSEYVCKKDRLTASEAKEKAKMRLDNYILELEKKGVEIVKNNVKIYIDNKVCIAKGNIVYDKNIACDKGD